MKFLASRPWRIFLIAWLVYSAHFATNIVREHYPAFTFAEHGTFRVDEYQGFHSDIFVHRDGHSVIGNQVFVSMLAAVPLFIFDPVLDALEERSKAKIAREGVTNDQYRIDKPMRVQFFRLVKERGLDLRFGAATVITSVFFMAPLTAAFLAFFYRVCGKRGLAPPMATELTFLLGFGTALFFRTSTLNHNMFVMFAMFIAFILLWPATPGGPLSLRVRLAAGLFAGLTLATDYVGVIIMPLLFGYFVLPRVRVVGWRQALTESLAIIAGALPAIGFLFFSQWAMYGDPFRPGQSWMPNQNIYVNVGMRGWTLPDLELFWMSLFDPSFGMYTWTPLLLLALWPVRRGIEAGLVLPRLERRWLAVTWIIFLLFTSANQYSRLQFNSGFRYLIPLVPFLTLALADHWIRFSRGWRIVIGSAVVLHSWVLTVFREPIGKSWAMLFDEGPQLPWYRVLGLTAAPGNPWLGTWWVPSMVLLFTALVAAAIWRTGSRMEKSYGTS